MGRGSGRVFLAIAQGLGDWRRERAATAEQQRLEKREDDWRNSQIEREDVRYRESLLREPGVEVLEPTVRRTVLPPPSPLPEIALGAPEKPTALASAASNFAPSTLPKPDFGRPFEVQDRNPAIEGKIALRPEEGIYFDQKWQENKTRAERTALRDAAIAAGADPKNAELLLTNPSLIGNILPKPEKQNGWTVMGHEYGSEAEANAARVRFGLNADGNSDGAPRLTKTDRRRIANAKIDDMMRTGSRPLSVWDALEADPNTKGALTMDEVADRTRSIEDARAKAAKGDAGDEILALVRKRLRETGAGAKSEAEVPEQRRAITQDQADYLMAAPPQGKGWTQQQVNARYTVKQ